MATYTLTEANVHDGVGTPYIAAEEIKAGEWVYLDKTDNDKANLADNSSAVKAAVEGIAINHAYADQPINIVKGGSIDIGTGPAVAEMLIISNTAGKMMDPGDLANGQFATLVGHKGAGNTMTVSILRSGIAYDDT